MNQELEKIIKSSSEKKTVELDLSGQKLSEIPSDVFELTHLKKLDLSNNLLKALPAEISNLSNLVEMDVSHNQLTELPSAIGALSSLKKLVLGKEIKNEGRETSNLLTNLPPEIGNLKKLEILHAFHNKIVVLPLEIQALTNLVDLGLGSNRLSSFPKEITKLRNLRELRLWNNHIEELPPEIQNLSQLATLHLRNNKISRLPAQIVKLKGLEKLILSDNPLQIPPEILERPPTDIIDYYLEGQSTETRSLNEAKILFVGQGDVGKTSLLKRLLDDTFESDERATKGINIFNRQSRIIKGQEMRLNFWDFGGQEVMHATHQFFLTKRSLYILVLNSRQSDEENRIEYWLKMIQSLGGESPVIVVSNKIDQYPSDLNYTGLKSKYANIREFLQTSCKTGTGIQKLWETIENEVIQLPHVHDELPIKWYAVKANLEKRQENYLSYSDYQKLCETENIEGDKQQTLLGFLHDLGVVLNYRDDLRLSDTNILNPRWVTNGVYQILNSNSLFQQKGVLDEGQIESILDPPSDYPKNKQGFILDMMQKFELCFEFDVSSQTKRFLIPDLLSRDEPYTGEWDQCLKFEFHYDILPSSIISRFIVRSHPKAYRKTYWRSGILLRIEENNVLVKADLEEKRIFIWVVGPSTTTRRQALAYVRLELDTIHGTFPDLRVQKKVPIPNHPEAPPVDYKYLRTLEEKDYTYHLFEGVSEEISVKELLGGVDQDSTRQNSQKEKVNIEDEQPSKIDKFIQFEAENYAKRIFTFVGFVLTIIAGSFVIFIYRQDWNILEPQTFIFISIVFPLIYYFYFAITLRTLSIKEFKTILIKSRTKKLQKILDL